MPREVVHWKVLDTALERLEKENSLVASALRKYPDVARLGAIAHDAPYYHDGGRGKFGYIAHVLHDGDGGDTNEPMRKILMEILQEPENDQPLLLALLAGMLTHCATDRVFHPLIYYFTGNYHDRDVKKRKLART